MSLPPRNEGPRLSADEAASLVAHVAQLSAAGLPLAAGLRAAAEELPARPAAALRDVAQSVEAGHPLDEALAALQNRVPAHVSRLMSAGLRSGQLAQVLDGYLQHQQHAGLHRQAWLAVAYPAILILMVAGVTLFYALVVASGLADVYVDFGTELPAQTQLLLSVSRLRWPVWLGIGLCLALAILLDWLVLESRVRRTMLSLLPILGPLSRWLSMASLCRMLALLIEQQVPLPEALRLAADVVRDPLVRGDVHRVSQRVSAGQSMAEAAQGTWLPPTFAALAGGGGSVPLLRESLTAAAELFEGQAGSELKLLRAVAPALAFILVLLVVGFLITSTMMPMIRIIETLT